MANSFIFPKIHTRKIKEDSVEKTKKKNQTLKIKILQKYRESYVHHDQPIFIFTIKIPRGTKSFISHFTFTIYFFIEIRIGLFQPHALFDQS